MHTNETVTWKTVADDTRALLRRTKQRQRVSGNHVLCFDASDSGTECWGLLQLQTGTGRQRVMTATSKPHTYTGRQTHLYHIHITNNNIYSKLTNNQLREVTRLWQAQKPPVLVVEVTCFQFLSSGTLFHYTFTHFPSVTNSVRFD